MCLFELRQESCREPISEVSERATNDNSAREIGSVSTSHGGHGIESERPVQAGV